ncbi:transcriptional regulator [Halostella sp. JP-L12]|uniref:RAD55 family ATPase n=1 Tax=Halostella TaxID=1843185 RepID=UPI000EF8111E|nr:MULTISPECIES: transcriptional regulator [Halostella]NHN48533.1 transcriptional regulator [Halostella sp. JP-L12]
MGGCFATGVDMLDRELDGGIPAGSVAALSAPPASQSERLLYELTNEQRTLYVTTERAPEPVEAALRETADPGAVRVRGVGGDDPLRELLELARAVADGTLIVVDPAAPLERESEYRAALVDLRKVLREKGSAAVLHCVDGRAVPEGRDVTEYMADLIFDLSVEVERDRLRTRLTVPKFRRGDAPRAALKLDFRRRVTVDNSRDIA